MILLIVHSFIMEAKGANLTEQNDKIIELLLFEEKE
jgi:hypothetical protein